MVTSSMNSESGADTGDDRLDNEVREKQSPRGYSKDFGEQLNIGLDIC